MSSETTHYEFRLPDPGEGLTEAELVAWHVAERDAVEEDAPLCNVETDKAVVEIPAPCTGTLVERRAEPNDSLAVADVIAVFETEDPPRRGGSEPTDLAPSPKDADTDVEEPADDDRTGAEADDRPDATPESRVFAAPSTWRYAREQGVDIAAVTPIGPGGRVLREDVDRHRASTDAAGVPSVANRPPPPQSNPRRGWCGSRCGASGGASLRTWRGRPRRYRTSHRGSRPTPANWSRSKERLNRKYDTRITYTAILVKAVVPALEEFPLVNASVDMEAGEILKHREYNVGVATHTEDGLLVPVIDHVDRKSVVEVTRELNEKAASARERSLAPSDLQDGTFTVTNTGSHGEHGTFGTPIIRRPEAAILGVGRIREKPVAVDGELAVRERIDFSLSYDHRLMDGVTAERFAETVIEAIEDPDLLLSRI